MNLASRGTFKPQCLWFTGLSASGKSTIAELLVNRLKHNNVYAYVIDGDLLRQGISRDLGFADSDRVENMRRAAEVARMMVDAGLIVIVALISPFKSERLQARQRFAEGEFAEVYINTPIDICISRDPKGLYARALRGDIPQFTGLDSVYEAPEAPDLTISGTGRHPQDCVEDLMSFLQR